MAVKYDANTIAQYFLYKMPMTQKKLHKLLYFAYAWYLYQNNDNADNLDNKLFENKFEAWVHGPVYQPLYGTYASYGMKPIEVNDLYDKIDENDKKFLDDFLDKYGNLEAWQLENLSHKEIAWLNARRGLDYFDLCNKKLNDRDIFLQLDELR